MIIKLTVNRLRDYDTIAEAKEWCKQRFGASGWDRAFMPRGQIVAPLICSVRWQYRGNGYFEFTFEQDTVQFALRWA
jgi:hypothetical protein